MNRTAGLPDLPLTADRAELEPGLFLLPTAAGAYHALSRLDDTPLRRLLVALLAQPETPPADVERLCAWVGTGDRNAALATLEQAQALAFVQGYREPRSVPSLGVGQELGHLLPQLSSVGKGMLVDWNGLRLATIGVADDVADALAALSADLIAVQERHSDRLIRHLGLGTHGWAAVNAHGSSRIGAWPLYVGETRLMLVLLGEPRLNRLEFLSLAWLLTSRYG